MVARSILAVHFATPPIKHDCTRFDERLFQYAEIISSNIKYLNIKI